MEEEHKECEQSTEDIYNRYKEQYQLPEYNTIHKFLKITDIEDDDLFLINLKGKIIEKVHKFAEILEPIVQPDTSTASMRENSFFSDEDRIESFKIYSELQVIAKDAELVSLDEDDQQNGEFILSAIKQLEKIKEEIKTVLEKQKESWTNIDDIKENPTGYFG